MSNSNAFTTTIDKIFSADTLWLVFWASFLIAPHLIIYACSDGVLLGRGCTVSTDYIESYSVVSLAWPFIFVIGLAVIWLSSGVLYGLTIVIEKAYRLNVSAFKSLITPCVEPAPHMTRYELWTLAQDIFNTKCHVKSSRIRRLPECRGLSDEQWYEVESCLGAFKKGHNFPDHWIGKI